MGIDARTGRWSRLVVGAACAAAITVGLPGVALAAPAVPPAAPAAQSTTQAARSADAAQRARAAWETHGRPTALVVVRPTSVDLVDQGRLTRRIPRAGGTLTLAGLDRYLPRDWLSITGDTARLSAAVVLTPTVTLDVGAPVTTLQLAGGATAPEAASISTGSGGLTLHGVTVTSVDRTSGQAMAPGPGRPFVLVSPGGRFTATDATLSDLGTAPRDGREQADVEDHPGLDFHTGSTGSLVRTSLLRNGTGLQLDGSQGVHLEGVTVSGSAGTGLVLRGDRGTTMTGVRAEHNGAYGVQVTGPSTDRPITGIVTTGNGSFGIGLDKQTGTHITAVSTSGDGAAVSSEPVPGRDGLRAHRRRRTRRRVHPRQQRERGARPADGHRWAARRGDREDHPGPDRAGLDDPGRLRRRDRRRRQGRRAARCGRARLPDGAAGRAGRGRRHRRRSHDLRRAGRGGRGPGIDADGPAGPARGRPDGHGCPLGEPGRQDLGGAITGGATGIDVAAATSISGTPSA